jgi:hypothetical protein
MLAHGPVSGVAAYSPGPPEQSATHPEPRGTTCEARFLAHFRAEKLDLVGFPSVHGKGVCWRIARGVQHRMIFSDSFFNTKNESP